MHLSAEPTEKLSNFMQVLPAYMYVHDACMVHGGQKRLDSLELVL